MLTLLLACASSPSPDTSDTSGTTAPKMTEAECELEDGEFLVYVGTDLPPAAVIYVGGDSEGVPVWRVADSVAYREGVFHISPTIYTRCLAYIQ